MSPIFIKKSLKEGPILQKLQNIFKSVVFKVKENP